MSATNSIAVLLGLSFSQAVSYCEQVRLLSGLGAKLQYKTINDQLKLNKPPYPDATSLANKIGSTSNPPKSTKTKGTKIIGSVPKPSKHPVAKVPNLTVKARFKNKRSFSKANLKMVVPQEIFSGTPDFEPYVPSLLPKNVERYSYQNHERISSEDLDHCKHNIRSGQLCAICNPDEFRRMTGID